jgi:hypothetical protein
MNANPSRAACAALLLLVALSGCGSGIARVPIKGKVTLDDQPLAKGSILFVPMEGTTGVASGGDIINGEYQLTKDNGAAAGWNRVEITAMKKSGEKVPNPLGKPGEMVELEVPAIAPRFNSASEMKHEVKPGVDGDFKVFSK